ncbi:MAG: DUF2784 domain-containing protein [Granulosicoccaceae bacterium]|jgi:hypothetical protein
MFYSLVADLLVVVHLGFIFFVVFGGLLVLKWRRLVYVHLPAALWGALLELFGWLCPLTPWEKQLRLAAGEEGYTVSFVEHYLLPIVYPPHLGRELQIGLGLFVVVINIAVYGWLLARHRRTAGRAA